MIKTFSTGLSEIDTFDSYFNSVLIKGKKLCIPYINLGVSNHILNPRTDLLMYISMAYLIFEEIEFLKVNSNILLINNNIDIESCFLGGINVDSNGIVSELEIKAKKGFLQLNQNAIIREEMWIPRDSPNFKKNMDSEDINFLSDIILPSNLAVKFEDYKLLSSLISK